MNQNTDMTAANNSDNTNKKTEAMSTTTDAATLVNNHHHNTTLTSSIYDSSPVSPQELKVYLYLSDHFIYKSSPLLRIFLFSPPIASKIPSLLNLINETQFGIAFD
jgi:hypothetical protein